MTLTNTVVAKLAVAFVAISMVFTLALPAQAQTADELQAMIDSLMAQIDALNSQLGTGSGSTGSCVSIPAPLTMGAQGADVTALQNFLIGAGQVIPAGATGYFGGQTQAALAGWQAANGVAPAVGYYGPITKAAVDASCVPATDDIVDDMDDSDDDMSDDDDMELQGEGALDDSETDFDEEEDEVQEGAEEVIAILTLGAEDGDIEVSRLKFSLVADAGVANTESDPWDVFETVTLLVDGDEIASFEADDEDNYSDEDAGEFRFTNLGLVIEEDEEVDIEVAVEVTSSVKDADTDGKADWDLDALEIRYFDADGVAETENLGVDAINFDVTEEGAEDGASIESNSDTPEAETLLVDGDTAEEEYEVFIFDIEVDRDSSDLELTNAYLDVVIANPATNADIGNGQEDVIDSITMTIDGETVEGDDLASTHSFGHADMDDVIASSSNTRVAYEFDFDGLMLEGDTDYEVVVAINFRGQDSDEDYENGVTVVVDVTGTQWDLEGLATDNELTGTETSETMTLANVVPTISDVDDTVTVDDPNNSGTISWEFTVAADQGDEDVVLSFTDVDGVIVGNSDDVRFTITGVDTTIGTGTLTKVSGDATMSAVNNTWTIADGDEATFALDVSFATVAASDNGTYRVTLDSVDGVEVDETSGALSLSHS